MRRRSALVVALLVGLAGCGGDDRPVGRTTATEATTTAARAPGPDCGQGVRSHAIRFATRDGLSLSGAVVGSGRVGAVLIHEYPLDFCGWWPYARYLSRRGVHALVFDLRCFGSSPCPGGRGHSVTDVAAARAELRRRGARRIALVGASMGGAIAVVAAAQLHPAAVVDLSGERNTAGPPPRARRNPRAAP